MRAADLDLRELLALDPKGGVIRFANERVLLVDDDSEIVESMRTVLESRGYQILVARDGNQGLMMAETEEPDLVVLDMMMPKRSGFLVLEKLRRSHPVPMRVIMITGDSRKTAHALAHQLGISEFEAEALPERKLEWVLRLKKEGHRVAMAGDGINDAPAISAATVGIAFGAQNEITSEASGAVILDSSLSKVDELIHIGQRMKRIALESAGIGISLSLAAMVFAAFGWIAPVTGALIQEAIDVLAVLNALRVPWQDGRLSDYES